MQTGLTQSNQILGLFNDLQHTDINPIVESVTELDFPKNKLENNEVCFYKIDQLSYEEDYPRREAFENVLLSMDNEAFNFVYILTGTQQGIELCVGVVKNKNENQPVLGRKLSTSDYGKIIANVFEGNFSGSKLKKITGDDLNNLIDNVAQKYKNAGVIIGIPSVNDKESGDEFDFQGIDRLVNSMLGLEWRLVVVCEPVSRREIQETRANVYELYNRLSVCSKNTLQHSETDGSSISFGSNQSESRGKNSSFSKGKSNSKGDSSSSNQTNENVTTGESKDTSKGTNQSVSSNRGYSNSVTMEMANKQAQEIMNYIDDELLKRLKTGYSKGLFKSSIYYMAKEPTHANRLKVGIMSLFQGDNSVYSPLNSQIINLDKPENKRILSTYQNQYVDNEGYSEDALLLLGRPYDNRTIALGSYLTTDEISLIAGLPQKEVPGLSLREGVGFGLNEKNVDLTSAINLGTMVQKGRDLEKIPFYLSKSSMAKHTFVAGVTGSGKTTTCHRLLSEANMPFLVIEPAKTEYRTLINQKDDIVVFTLGNESVAPFRINPFELIEGEVISAHVDMIKATFTSAFPMEASMPQILEEAIYRCYQKKGWNIDTNENDKYGVSAFDPDVNSFPIMSELLEEMRTVVESKHFSAQMQADYIGSLVSRLSNLTVGSKGSMLNCEHSTDFKYIANHNVILEMEELKSPEDKALFMGFVLSRLSAVIKALHKENSDFKHLTLIEEAHRLLSKVDYGDNGPKKAAVETFTDLLAEVRKYGEGLIIVDQIPNKLASEVLKNTNTKIIHKILARDDKEAVGDTMLMNDKQKEYLSALTVGNAIVFSEQTDKPVHVHITAISNTNEDEIDNSVVRNRFLEKRSVLGSCYDNIEILPIYPLFEQVIEQIKNEQVELNSIEMIKQKIQNISNKYEIDIQHIWEKLLIRRDNISGKATGSSTEQNVRIEFLASFIEDVLYKEPLSIQNFNFENIGADKYQKIMQYLN